MVLPKLISHHLKHGDDAEFYRIQAVDAIEWLGRNGVTIGNGTHAIDLGCGHGVFGDELLNRGCKVTFSDEENFLIERLRYHPFKQFNIDAQELSALGEFDLVICSNVLEHLFKPEKLLATLQNCVCPGGWFYLSWTNWLSPWGGHEFSPFHYLGPRLGPKVADRLTGKKRKHIPYENLFPTSIGRTISLLKENRSIRVAAVSPRYYPEFRFVSSIPVLREFFTWNCVILIQRLEH